MLHSCPEDVVHMLLEESNQCYVSFILHAGSVHVGWNVWFSAVSTCTMYIILLGVLAMKYSIVALKCTCTCMFVFGQYYNVTCCWNMSQLLDILTYTVHVNNVFASLLSCYLVYCLVAIYWTFSRFIGQCPAWLAVSTPLPITIMHNILWKWIECYLYIYDYPNMYM